MKHKSYLQTLLGNFFSRPLGLLGMALLGIFLFIALYAPFFASSKPLCVVWDGTIYFPLFRYLLSSAFFTKNIDLFFNLLGLFFPFYLLTWRYVAWRYILTGLLAALFVLFGFFVQLDPANASHLNRQKEALILQLTSKQPEKKQEQESTLARPRSILPSWDVDLEYMNDYQKLNLVLSQYTMLKTFEAASSFAKNPYTLYLQERDREKEQLALLKVEISDNLDRYTANRAREEEIQDELISAPAARKASLEQKRIKLEEENEAFEELQNRLEYIQERREWLERQLKAISFIVMPPLSIHHWEDDVGGEQALNLKLPFTLETRINRKDLMSALIFGSRISLFVGLAATLLALGIGVPLGLISGYYGAKTDMILCRFVEVWEAMPVFFMLLLIVSILETKSIFVIITVISVFSWMSAFRFIRAETFRQRNMLYVDAAKAVGFPDHFILLCQILPNSIIAVLALLPFDIMAAITREAGLAFLGLGEENSCSWGVLMDEGRSAFPADSSLLWPPAIVLTILLIAVAFVGQALHAALDPKTEE